MLLQTNYNNAHPLQRRALTGLQVILLLALLSIGVMTLMVILNNLSTANRSTRCRSRLLIMANGFDLFQTNHHQSNPYPTVKNMELNLQLGKLTLTDSTADLHLFMIINNYYPAHLTICPGESNPAVRAINDEQTTTIKPGEFRTDLDGGPNHKSWSNVSYANQIPANINNNLNPRSPSNLIILTDRGPKNGQSNPSSYSNQLHSPKNTWQGNIIFKDHHIQTLHEQSKNDNPFAFIDSNGNDDNIFNLDDKTNHTDQFLALFRSSISSPNQLFPVWD